MSPDRAPGDHFSGVSAGYARYRPRYPAALFDEITRLVPRHMLAWDCGAGTGQATLDLAERFDRVIATDVSAAQIAQAPPHPRISWRIATAESTEIRSGTVDLITVAQALHWFDQPAFFGEVRRVAAPDAVVAIWSYGSVELAGAVGEAVSRFEHSTVGPYWPPERAQVYALYASVQFPFMPLAIPAIPMTERWTRERLLGYLRTWSATSRYAAEHRVDPVSAFAEELALLWPDAEEPRPVNWPLTVIAGRVQT